MTEQDVVRFIDRERRRQGIKTKALCSAVGLTDCSYYHWTEGRTAPRLYNVLDFLHALGYDIEIVKKGNTPQRKPVRDTDGSRP